MNARVWVYNTLTADPACAAIFGPRVWAAPSLQSVPGRDEVPFLVYHFGNSSDPDLGPEVLVEHQWLQLWAHDQPGDFKRIDSGLYAAKRALYAATPNKAAGVMEIEFSENSRDLDDREFNTWMRYSRYQITISV